MFCLFVCVRVCECFVYMCVCECFVKGNAEESGSSDILKSLLSAESKCFCVCVCVSVRIREVGTGQS